MNKNGLFISVIANVLFRSLDHFLKKLLARLNMNLLPLEKLEPLVRSCPFTPILRFINFVSQVEFKYFIGSCNLKFGVSNRVNNNCCMFSLYVKKRKIADFPKRFFCQLKKFNKEISRNYKLKASV